MKTERDIQSSQEKREENITQKYLLKLRSLHKLAKEEKATCDKLIEKVDCYIKEYRKNDENAEIMIDDSENNYYNLCHILVYFPHDSKVIIYARKLSELNRQGLIKALTKIRYESSEERITPLELALMKGRVDYAVFIIEFLLENKIFDSSYIEITYKIYRNMSKYCNTKYPLDFEKFLDFFDKISRHLLKSLPEQPLDFCQVFFSNFYETFKENGSKISQETKKTFSYILNTNSSLLDVFKKFFYFKQLSILIDFSINIPLKEPITMDTTKRKEKSADENPTTTVIKKGKTNVPDTTEKDMMALIDYILKLSQENTELPKNIKEIIEPRLSTMLQKNKKKLTTSQLVKSSKDITPPDLNELQPKDHHTGKKERSTEDKKNDREIGRKAEQEVFNNLFLHYSTRYLINKSEKTKLGFKIEGKNKAKFYNATIEVTWFNKDQPANLDASHTYGYDFFVKKTKTDSVQQQIVTSKAIEVKGTSKLEPTEARFTKKELENLVKMGNRYKIFRVYGMNEKSSTKIVPITGLDEQLSFTEEALKNISHLNYVI